MNRRALLARIIAAARAAGRREERAATTKRLRAFEAQIGIGVITHYGTPIVDLIQKGGEASDPQAEQDAEAIPQMLAMLEGAQKTTVDDLLALPPYDGPALSTDAMHEAVGEMFRAEQALPCPPFAPGTPDDPSPADPRAHHRP